MDLNENYFKSKILNTVIAYRAYDTTDAHHVKNLLESAGINCMLKNENINAVLNFGGMQKDFEVLVMVYEKDYKEAREIIEDIESKKAKITCNNCGSKDVKLVLNENKFIHYYKLIISFFFMTPILNFKMYYECKNCGHKQD